jgi:hypothetical protein
VALSVVVRANADLSSTPTTARTGILLVPPLSLASIIFAGLADGNDAVSPALPTAMTIRAARIVSRHKVLLTVRLHRYGATLDHLNALDLCCFCR